MATSRYLPSRLYASAFVMLELMLSSWLSWYCRCVTEYQSEHFGIRCSLFAVRSLVPAGGDQAFIYVPHSEVLFAGGARMMSTSSSVPLSYQSCLVAGYLRDIRSGKGYLVLIATFQGDVLRLEGKRAYDGAPFYPTRLLVMASMVTSPTLMAAEVLVNQPAGQVVDADSFGKSSTHGFAGLGNTYTFSTNRQLVLLLNSYRPTDELAQRIISRVVTVRERFTSAAMILLWAIQRLYTQDVLADQHQVVGRYPVEVIAVAHRSDGVVIAFQHVAKAYKPSAPVIITSLSCPLRLTSTSSTVLSSSVATTPATPTSSGGATQVHIILHQDMVSQTSVLPAPSYAQIWTTRLPVPRRIR